MPSISILDYGVGNLASVRNAIESIGVPVEVIGSASAVRASRRLLLPGVGAFASAMEMLRLRGLDEAVKEHASERTRPLLGVCLGMQLLFDESLEGGKHEGLGILQGQVRSMVEFPGGLPIPHMGWNEVIAGDGASLVTGVEAFYFVHGYHCRPGDEASDMIAGLTEYGSNFVSVVERGNVHGVQFHPEKSQKGGLALLKRFSEL